MDEYKLAFNYLSNAGVQYTIDFYQDARDTDFLNATFRLQPDGPPVMLPQPARFSGKSGMTANAKAKTDVNVYSAILLAKLLGYQTTYGPTDSTKAFQHAVLE